MEETTAGAVAHARTQGAGAATSFFRRLLPAYCDAGMLLGALFVFASLTPSLIPRAAPAQAALSGACFAIGYGLGVLLRWLWRFVTLTWLMFQLSRIPLQLSVLHPDRTGGLSFLALYPTVFNGLLFAVGSALAASFIRDLSAESIAVETVQFAVAAWIGFVLVIVVGPLAAFVPCLSALKSNAVVRYGHLATEFHQGLERKWLGSGATAGDLLASNDASTAADLNAIVASIWDMRVIPVDRSTVLSVALAAGIPMLAVLAKQMPLEELARSLVSAVL